MLPPELLTHIGRLAVQQAQERQQLGQAVRFAYVCRAFRTATLDLNFWPPEPQLKLTWNLAESAISRLVLCWVPYFRAVRLCGGSEALGQPAARLRQTEDSARTVSVSIRESQRQGDTELLTICLGTAQQLLSTHPHLHVFCEGMSPAAVQLLAGLRLTKLDLFLSSGCCLDMLLAAHRTDVHFWGDWAGLERDQLPLLVNWTAMTTARASSFHFAGPVAVTGYSGLPLIEAYVEVCNTGEDQSVMGLPWDAMQAGHDGWQVRHDGLVFAKGLEP